MINKIDKLIGNKSIEKESGIFGLNEKNAKVFDNKYLIAKITQAQSELTP